MPSIAIAPCLSIREARGHWTSPPLTVTLIFSISWKCWNEQINPLWNVVCHPQAGNTGARNWNHEGWKVSKISTQAVWFIWEYHSSHSQVTLLSLLSDEQQDMHLVCPVTSPALIPGYNRLSWWSPSCPPCPWASGVGPKGVYLKLQGGIYKFEVTYNWNSKSVNECPRLCECDMELLFNCVEKLCVY